MKKRIIISLVMMILLLAATCLPAAAEPPATKKLPCAYCNRNRTFEFVGYSANKTTHYPAYKCTTCKRVGSTMSGSGAHTGGTATCTQKAVCVVCNHEYGDYVHDLEHHEGKAATCTESGWEAYDTCKRAGCNYTTYRVIPASHDLVHHDALAPTCTQNGYKAYETCKNCDYSTYTADPALDHDWGDWLPNGNVTHTRTCKRDAAHTETEACTSFFPADCISGPRCRVCWGVSGEKDPNNHPWRQWYSNGDGTHTRTCNHNVLEAQTEPCSGGNATCLIPGTCSMCGGQYLADHMDTNKDHLCDTCQKKLSECADKDNDHRCDYCGAQQSPHSYEAVPDAIYLKSEATCVSPAVYFVRCSICKEKGTATFEVGDKNPDNHDLEHYDSKAAACTEKGWKAYDRCRRDGCAYTTYQEIPAMSHWYGEWTPNADDTHTAQCRRSGCYHRTVVKCEKMDAALPNQPATGEESNEFSLCPVCGAVSDGTRLVLVERATVKALTHRFPAGEVVARMGKLENGKILLSIGFEFAGKLTQPVGQVQFALPASALNGYTLHMLNTDSTETELSVTVSGEEITFTLDFESQVKGRDVIIQLV